MSFKFFDPRPPEEINPACVNVREKWINLNKEALSILKNPTQVTIGYDPESKRIGIKAVTDNNPMQLPVKMIKDQGRLLTYKFVKMYNIESGKYRAVWDGSLKMLVAELIDSEQDNNSDDDQEQLEA